jgi:hypothetical protein
MKCTSPLLLLLLLLDKSAAQNDARMCLPYDTDVLPSPCSSIMPSVYAYSTEEQLNASIAYVHGTVAAVSGLLGETACGAPLVDYVCVSHTFVLGPTQRGIESCAVDPVGRPLEPAFVVPLCRSFCETLTATCAEFLVPSGSGAFLPNCTDLIDGPAIVESPREGFVAVNCFNGSTDASSAANSTSLQCPSGL